MTQTKDELDLIVPQRMSMYQHNGHESGHDPRYRGLSQTYSSRIRAKALDEPGAEPHSSKSKSRSKRIDVASRVARMWRSRHAGALYDKISRAQTRALHNVSLNSRAPLKVITG